MLRRQHGYSKHLQTQGTFDWTSCSVSFVGWFDESLQSVKHVWVCVCWCFTNSRKNMKERHHRVWWCICWISIQLRLHTPFCNMKYLYISRHPCTYHDIFIYTYKVIIHISITYDILTLCQCISSLHFTRITGFRDVLLAKDYHTAFAEALAPGRSKDRFARKAVKLVVFVLYLADDKIRSVYFVWCFFNCWLEWWMFLYVFVNLCWWVSDQRMFAISELETCEKQIKLQIHDIHIQACKMQA